MCIDSISIISIIPVFVVSSRRCSLNRRALTLYLGSDKLQPFPHQVSLITL